MTKGIKGVILVTILVLLIGGYYAYLSNRNAAAKEDVVAVTPVQKVLLRNMEDNYPPSPKEVVDYYSQITKCFYNEVCTEEEVIDLARRARELYDEELRADKDEEKYIADLKEDIDEYKLLKKTITNYSLSASVDVDYKTTDNREWAMLICTYSVRQGKALFPLKEEFLLRRDDNKRWKIYGWKLVEDK